MTHTKRLLVLAVLPIVGLWWIVPRGHAQVSTPLVTGPSTWVAFSATVTRTDPDQDPIVGRFFRGADGSDRLESGPALDDVRAVSIHNLTEETYYLYGEGRGWHAYPMQLQGRGQTPFTRARKVGATTDSASITYEGFAALQVTRSGGVVERVIPDLNFFAVDRLLGNGSRILYAQIQVGSGDPADLPTPQGPSRALLFDPTGESIQWHSEPSGIIMRSPHARQGGQS